MCSFFILKPTRRSNFPNLFCQETLHVSGSSSAHHQEFLTVNSALVYIMQFWWQLSSRTILVLLESCHQNCMIYTNAEFTVRNSWWWAEELPETCRVSWQNKFGKLLRLVGFNIKQFVSMHGHMNVIYSLFRWVIPVVLISIQNKSVCTSSTTNL